MERKLELIPSYMGAARRGCDEHIKGREPLAQEKQQSVVVGRYGVLN